MEDWGRSFVADRGPPIIGLYDDILWRWVVSGRRSGGQSPDRARVGKGSRLLTFLHRHRSNTPPTPHGIITDDRRSNPLIFAHTPVHVRGQVPTCFSAANAPPIHPGENG